MEEEQYEYDAFISYRHIEPDRGHAMWLHKALETYKVPGDLVNRGFPKKLKKAFRDEEELPASADLSGEIDRALKASKFLIVICSPRILDSIWCDAEVKRFRELGRHDKIIALLTEGEPSESFLPSLCEIRQHVIKDGVEIEEIEAVEPLAADIRPRPDQSVRELKQLAKLRLIACIIGCKFDDLRRRELRRKQRFFMLAGVFMLFLLVGFASLTLWALKEKKLAEENHLLAVENEKKALAEHKLAEERKRELLEEKLEILKIKISDFEDENKHYEALKLLNESIEVCHELNKDSESFKIRARANLESNRLLARFKAGESSSFIGFTKNDKYLISGHSSNYSLRVFSIEDKTELQKIQLKNRPGNYVPFTVRIIDSKTICHIYSDNRNTIMDKWDLTNNKLIESKVFESAYPITHSSVWSTINSEIHNQYFLTKKRLNENEWQVDLIKISDAKTVVSFKHSEDISYSSVFMIDGEPKVILETIEGNLYSYFRDQKKFIRKCQKRGNLLLTSEFVLDNKNLIFYNEPKKEHALKSTVNYYLTEAGYLLIDERAKELNNLADKSEKIVLVRSLGYGLKKAYYDKGKEQLLNISERSVSIYQNGNFSNLEQIKSIKRSAFSKNILATENDLGYISLWNVEKEKPYTQLSPLKGVEGIEVFDDKSKVLVKSNNQRSLKIVDLQSFDVLSINVPETGMKYTRANILKRSGKLAVRASDEFKTFLGANEKMLKQKLYIYDTQSAMLDFSLDEGLAYGLRDSYLLSFNERQAIKFRGLGKDDKWKTFDLGPLDCIDFRTVKDDGFTSYIMPFQGKYQDVLIKLDLLKQSYTAFKHEALKDHFLSKVTLSDDEQKALFTWLPGFSLKGKDRINAYMLFDFGTQTFSKLPESFQCDGQASFRIFKDKIAVLSGYPPKISVFDFKSFKQKFSVQLPESITQPNVIKLNETQSLIYQEEYGREAYLVSSTENKIVDRLPMKAYHSVSGFYANYTDNDKLVIKNLKQADFKYELDHAAYISYMLFTEDGKSLIFVQSDGLYKLDFQQSKEEIDLSAKMNDLFRAVTD